MPTIDREYGKVNFLEKLGIIGVVLTIPLVKFVALLKKPFSQIDRYRTWRRVLADATFFHTTRFLNITQMQFLSGGTTQTITNWAKDSNTKVVTEEVGEGARLHWLTPTTGERRSVLFYLHGGGYLLPIPPFTLGFWQAALKELAAKGKDPGFAILEYGLVPTTRFPTQMRQAIASLNHLISSGYHPEDIHIVGDSAGAGLALQVLSQLLHPLAGIPSVKLNGAKFGSAVLISPYATLDADSSTFVTNANKDLFTVSFLKHMGDRNKEGIPEGHRPYLECGKTPDDWFVGVDKYLKRSLITCGANECQRFDIENFARKFSTALQDSKLITSELGTHVEPYGSFLAKESTPDHWPLLIAGWLADGMA